MTALSHQSTLQSRLANSNRALGPMGFHPGYASTWVLADSRGQLLLGLRTTVERTTVSAASFGLVNRPLSALCGFGYVCVAK
jgi:hypothetical protein